MTSISGWVFMAVGAAVSLFARYIQKKGGEGLQLFFWVGIIMIGVGVFKIAVGFIMKEKKTEEDIAKERARGKTPFGFGINKDLAQVDSKDIAQEKQKISQTLQNANIIVCPSCGTKHYSNSNFCHICGSRLR